MKSKPTIRKRAYAFAVLVVLLGPSCVASVPANAQTAASAPGCTSQRLPRAFFEPAPPPREGSGGYVLPKEPVKPIDVAAPAAKLMLFVAADIPSRELGLMCVVAMKPHVGMLFAFAQDGPQPFWMKNTLIPLDMVFVRGDGVVTSVAADVPQTKPGTSDDELARRTGDGRYVIELNADEAGSDGIRPGVHLRIPAIEAQ